MQGGHYVLYPIILAKLYGSHGGLTAYTVGYSFQGVASFINTLIIKLLFPNILDFKGVCMLYGIFTILALFLLLFVYKGSKMTN